MEKDEESAEPLQKMKLEKGGNSDSPAHPLVGWIGNHKLLVASWFMDLYVLLWVPDKYR